MRLAVFLKENLAKLLAPSRGRARSVWSARSLLPLSDSGGCRALRAVEIRQLCAAAFLALLCSFFATHLSGAEKTNEEQALIRVLQSAASPAEKDAACARLKRIGTAKAIPALSSLLLDEQLSHSARYALESMPRKAAGRALLNALGKTSGQTRIGIINSLAVRHEAKAVPELAELLVASERRTSSGDPDEDSTAIAAAHALGKIGTAQALTVLEPASAKSLPAPNHQLHDALTDALLRCANDFLTSGRKSQALSVFKRVYQTESRDALRTAAYRGMILSSGKQGLTLMTSAILGEESAARIAALQLVRAFQGPEATDAIARLLPQASPFIKVALIKGLSQRNDPIAAVPISSLVSSPAPEVRIAAITALGNLGAASDVRLLAESAASSSGEEQTAARESLSQLWRGEVTAALISELPKAKPDVQAELARALGQRGDAAAIPKLLELVKQAGDSARRAELQALALLVGQQQLDSMVVLVSDAKEDAARSDAVEALLTACQRIQPKQGRLDATPIAKGLGTGSRETRIALLPICSGLVDAGIRSQLRDALHDSDAKVRDTANRTICDTTDPDLLPDVVKLAMNTPEENLRTLALGGCVRLLTQEEKVKLSNSERVHIFQGFLALPLSSSQKQTVLSGLAEIPDTNALATAQSLLQDPAVNAEAVRAIVKIALGLAGKDKQVASTALKKAIESTSDSASIKSATAALNQIEARADFITDWDVAGPYRQAGKNFSALFDIPFPPETTNAVKWQSPVFSSNSSRPGAVDLLKTFGGEQCVAYGRTQIYSTEAQPALLEIGSDDGVKAWLNSEVVHANNVSRALQPDSDKVSVHLKAGWNQLLLKITQNTQGWGFCARLRKPDGSPLEQLRFSVQQ